MYGNRLSFSDDVKFLGLVLDTKLSWIRHIKYLQEECNRRLRILKVLAKTSWGADHKTMLMLYTSLVRSKIDYGSIVYSSAKSNHLQLLDTIHPTGIRLSTGAFRTSPIISLCAEASIPPLAFRRRELMCSYGANMKTQNRNPAYNYVFQPKNIRLFVVKPTSAPLGIREYTLINEILGIQLKNSIQENPPWKRKPPKIDFNLMIEDPISVRSKALEILEHYCQYTTMYTDGSKKGEDVGFAVINVRIIKKYKLPPYTSTYTAELQAISLALKLAIECNNSKILICSDSLSALKSIENLKKSGHTLNRIRNHLDSLYSRNKSVQFLWTPAHSGIAGNEKADMAAKEAANMKRPFRQFTSLMTSRLC